MKYRVTPSEIDSRRQRMAQRRGYTPSQMYSDQIYWAELERRRQSPYRVAIVPALALLAVIFLTAFGVSRSMTLPTPTVTLTEVE